MCDHFLFRIHKRYSVSGQMYSIDAHATFNYTPGIFGNLGYGAKGTPKNFRRTHL